MLALVLPLFFIIFGIILLLILAVIDFRTFYLPNIYVYPFAAAGVLFHLASSFAVLTPSQMGLGAITGFGLLYFVRWGGNRYYKQESLGFGDVKLMGAAGLWLGPQGILFAMTLGAFFSLLHGFIFALLTKIKTGGPFTIARLVIPAGPGFIGGILVIGGLTYADYLYDLFMRLFY
jgi:prepilin signal peptidase PulO-like enzyme (type II secretory pathway)